jgi:hypothetical protein
MRCSTVWIHARQQPYRWERCRGGTSGLRGRAVLTTTAGDDAERSDAEERRMTTAGDDAERSDAEERRMTDDPDGGST